MANNPNLIAYANGTYRPDQTNTKQQVKLKNRLLVPIAFTLINSDGSLSGTREKVNPGKDSDKIDSFVGAAWLVTLETTGALIDVVVVAQEDGTSDLRVDQSNLPTPSIVGTPPADDDVPTFLVAQGVDPKNDDKTITRELWWFLTSDSTSLAPGESRMWKFSLLEGVEDSATSLTEMSSQLGTSASAGWGPISTSIEHSLSKSSSTSQTVTLTTSRTQEETRSLANTLGKGDMTVRVWQVRERYTVWKNDATKEVVQIINDTSHVQAVTTYSDGSSEVQELDLQTADAQTSDALSA